MFSNSSVGCSGYLWEGSNQINGISVVTQLNDPTDATSARPASLGPYTRTPYYPSFDIDHILYESSDNYEYSTPGSYPSLRYSSSYSEDADLLVIGATWYGSLPGHEGSTMLTSTGMVHKVFDDDYACWIGGTPSAGVHDIRNGQYESVFHADGYLLYEIVDDPCYNEFDSANSVLELQLTADSETVNWRHVSYAIDSNGDLHLLYGVETGSDYQSTLHYKKFLSDALYNPHGYGTTPNSGVSIAGSAVIDVELTGLVGYVSLGETTTCNSSTMKSTS